MFGIFSFAGTALLRLDVTFHEAGRHLAHLGRATVADLLEGAFDSLLCLSFGASAKLVVACCSPLYNRTARLETDPSWQPLPVLQSSSCQLVDSSLVAKCRRSLPLTFFAHGASLA